MKAETNPRVHHGKDGYIKCCPYIRRHTQQRSDVLGRVSQGINLANIILGLTPPACKPCGCPAWRPQQKPGHSDREKGFCGQGILQNQGSRSDTSPVQPSAGRTGQQVCHWGKEAALHGGRGVSRAHPFPRKPAALPPHQPLRPRTLVRAGVSPESTRAWGGPSGLRIGAVVAGTGRVQEEV